LPFRLHVADGTGYDVRHPELLLVTALSAHIGVPPDPPDRIPERAVTVAIGQVTRLETLPGDGKQAG
jgi:hypothetical protein